jgi:predicted HTH domain antitoxin
MIQISFEVNEGVLASLHSDAEHFAKEMRLAAAVKWYESGQISQGRAAEIAGISRSEFIQSLGRFNISPFQDTVEELIQEATDA